LAVLNVPSSILFIAEIPLNKQTQIQTWNEIAQFLTNASKAGKFSTTCMITRLSSLRQPCIPNPCLNRLITDSAIMIQSLPIAYKLILIML
jgi:hypothetical protein